MLLCSLAFSLFFPAATQAQASAFAYLSPRDIKEASGEIVSILASSPQPPPARASELEHRRMKAYQALLLERSRAADALERLAAKLPADDERFGRGLSLYLAARMRLDAWARDTVVYHAPDLYTVNSLRGVLAHGTEFFKFVSSTAGPVPPGFNETVGDREILSWLAILSAEIGSIPGGTSLVRADLEETRWPLPARRIRPSFHTLLRSYRWLLAERSRANSAAEALRAAYSPDDDRFVQGHVLYIKAKSRYDAMIRIVKKGLRDNIPPDDAARAAQLAASDVEPFFQYVKEKTGRVFPGDLGDAPPVYELQDWLRLMSEEFNWVWPPDASDRTRIESEIEALSWPAFLD